MVDKRGIYLYKESMAINEKEIDAAIANLRQDLFAAHRELGWVKEQQEQARAGKRSASSLARCKPSYEEALSAVESVQAELAPLNAIYSENPWTRYYLCKSSNGHVHSSQRCSTLFYNTTLAWLTDLSGDSEEEVVAVFGADVCTVCNPTAPVVSWSKSQRASDEKAAQKAAEKAAKKAAADAAKITVDGIDYKTSRVAATALNENIDKALDLGIGAYYALDVAPEPSKIDELIAEVGQFAAAGLDVVKTTKGFFARERKACKETIESINLRLETGVDCWGNPLEDKARADSVKRLQLSKDRIAAIPAIAEAVAAVAGGQR